VESIWIQAPSISSQGLGQRLADGMAVHGGKAGRRDPLRRAIKEVIRRHPYDGWLYVIDDPFSTA
jgi:hypothetical protein